MDPLTRFPNPWRQGGELMIRSRFLAPAGMWALAAALVLFAGCSKKSQAPPATTPPPAETPAEPVAQPPAEQPPAQPTEPAQLSWQDAYFDYDSYDLREDARNALDGNAKLMRDHATASVLIEGHCDERGTPEYNLALGERRANAAKDYLVAAGIDGSGIAPVSYGEERPFAAGHDEQSWAQNRRAHLVQK